MDILNNWILWIYQEIWMKILTIYRNIKKT